MTEYSCEFLPTLSILIMGLVFGFLIGMIYYDQQISKLKIKIKEQEASLRGFMMHDD